MYNIGNIIPEVLEKRDGVWFGPDGGYWSNLDREENNDYLKDLARLGSRKTVETYFPEHFETIFSPKRAAGLLLLDPMPGETIVDTGCMWGALTIPLAHSGANVIAIDQTPESLALLKQRLIDERLENVELVCADIKRICYNPSSIDKLVVNGVLEWIPESGAIELKKYYGKRVEKKVKGGVSPYCMQMDFLNKIYDGLKPGGTLYLAIENRYDIFHFFGLPDAHCSIRFITFMPRSVQNIMSKIILGRPYVNWIYSERALKKMLRTAGFNNIDIFYTFPNYRLPEHVLTKNGMKFFKPHKYRKTKNILAKIICYVIEDIFFRRLKSSVFSPSFIVLARK